MAARLAGKDPGQCLLLPIVRALVEVERRAPFGLHHVAGAVDRHGDVEAREVDLVVLALVDVPGHQHPALAFARRAEENAWARDVAVAGLEIGPLQLPGHRPSHPSCWT
jgi:hypothetical protein